VLINAEKVYLALTDDEATNWYEDWTHPQLAKVLTRLFKKNSDKFKTIDVAIESFKLNLESNDLHILDTDAEQEKITELHSLVDLFPPSIKNMQRSSRDCLINYPNYYTKIIFTEKKWI
jgi:hypothetical protein